MLINGKQEQIVPKQRITEQIVPKQRMTEQIVPKQRITEQMFYVVFILTNNLDNLDKKNCAN